MTQPEINAAIEKIRSCEATIDDIGAAINAVDYLYARCKETKAALEEAMEEHVKATGQPIIIGEWMWAMKTPKTTKEIDKTHLATVEQLLEFGGPASVAQGLGSDPWKHGTIREMEGMDDETFNKLFEVTYPPTLERGKTPKKLTKINTKFITNKGT